MKSDELESLVLDESPDAVIATTPEGKVLYWSKGAEATFGYAAAEAVGRRVDDIIVPPEHQPEERRILEEALKTGFSTHESVRFRKDGSRVYVDISFKSAYDDQGAVKFVVRDEKDVTQLRVRREAKLVDARFRALLEAMPDAIVIVNLAGCVVFSNSRADALFGYRRGDLQGKPVEQLLPDRYRNEHVVHQSRFFSAPRSRPQGTELELCGLHRDGTEFPVEISLSPLETEEGMLVSSAIRDITERKRVERALHEKNVELEAANKELEAFDYSISHDLRAPLNRIEGFSTMLGEEYGDKLDARGRDLLLRIAEARRSMDQLVGDLFALSTSTRGELRRSAVDVSALAELVVATLRKTEPQREMEFIAPAAMTVRADPGLLRVVLENLLGNAWKFTRRRARPRIEMGCVKRLGDLVFFVRDNGAGFDIARADKLFTPFQRLHSRNDFEGTGIGLATVQRIVRRHGGRVWAEATVDRGATFFFTLSA